MFIHFHNQPSPCIHTPFCVHSVLLFRIIDFTVVDHCNLFAWKEKLLAFFYMERESVEGKNCSLYSSKLFIHILNSTARFFFSHTFFYHHPYSSLNMMIYCACIPHTWRGKKKHCYFIQHTYILLILYCSWKVCWNYFLAQQKQQQQQ